MNLLKHAARFATVGACLLAMLVVAPSAEARPKYKSEFQKLYPDLVKKLGKTKVGCNVCHPKTEKSKKKRNDYGVALTKILGKKNETDVAKIKMALEKVAKEKNKASEVFGDKIKAGKLPGGEKAAN